MRSQLEYMREVERWIAWVRAGAVVFAVIEIGVFTQHHPPGYEAWAWAITGVFALGAAVLLVLSRREIAGARSVAAFALAFDTAIIGAYALVYSFEYGSQTRWALIFAVVEAALRYGMVGGVLLPVAMFPYLTFAEWWREREFGPPSFLWDRVTFPFGILLLNGLIVGWLVARLRKEATVAQTRAEEPRISATSSAGASTFSKRRDVAPAHSPPRSTSMKHSPSSSASSAASFPSTALPSCSPRGTSPTSSPPRAAGRTPSFGPARCGRSRTR